MTKTPNLSALTRLKPLRSTPSPSPLAEPLLTGAQKRRLKRRRERSTRPERWLILFLSCLLMSGSYYCYDNPAALINQLQSRFRGTVVAANFDYDFQLLYSVYSLPNIALPLLGGVLVDRAGVRFSLLLFSTLITLGQCLFAAGGSAASMELMLIGRALFGLGGESLAVAQSALVTQWFRGKELAMALGVNLSVARLGSVVNNTLSPWAAARYGVDGALWVGAAACVVSSACAVAIDALERRLYPGDDDDEAADDAAAKPATVAPASPRTAARVAREDTGVGQVVLDALRVARGFRPSFWLLGVSCTVVYSCVLPFNNVASALLQDRDYLRVGSRWRDLANKTWVYSSSQPEPPGAPCASRRGARLPFCIALAAAESRAGLVMSEPYMMSAVLAPILGWLVDRQGGRAALALASAVVLLVVHLLLALSPLPAELVLAGLGLGYSVFAAVIWPGVAYVVEPAELGTAYGVVTSLQNFGLFASPLLVGGVLAYTRDLSPTFPYFGVELLFAAQACLGVLSALALNLDAPTRRRLNAASPEKLPSATAPAATAPPMPTLAEPEGGSGRWSGTARPVPRVPDAPSEAPI